MQLPENISEDPQNSGVALRSCRGTRYIGARVRGRAEKDTSALARTEPRPTGASPYRGAGRRIALYAFIVSVIANSTGSRSILEAP
jgi:hypothetical protein